MKSMRLLSGLFAAGLLVACSSVPYAQRVNQRHAAYAQAAGAPVRHFNFFSLYSWEPLGEGQMAIYTRPNEAWLLDLGGACPWLDYTDTVGISSNLNQVSVGFDKVYASRQPFPCAITQIRPVDVTKLKLLQQEQHKIESRPRPVE